MDRVRLGRVLGRGARLAARTAYEAMDAATSAPPATSSPTKVPSSRNETTARPIRPRAETLPPQAAKPRAQSPNNAVPGMFAPVRRASRAVSLEVSGSFFALFALSFAMGMWHAREGVRAGPHGVVRFALYGLIALFFTYCSVSNFLRARRLQ